MPKTRKYSNTLPPAFVKISADPNDPTSYIEQGSEQVISTTPDFLVAQFPSQARLDEFFDVLDNTGVTVAFPGNNSSMTVTINTTSGSRWRIRSKKFFDLPVSLSMIAILSQRIAGNELTFRLVSQDTLDQIAVRFDSTLGTEMKYIWGANGQNSGPTSASPTGLNTATAFQYVIDTDFFDANVYVRSGNSSGGLTTVAQLNQNIPDPAKRYQIEIDLRNTAATASNTILTLFRVQLMDNSNTSVTVREGGGQTSSGAGVAVNVTSMPTTTVNTQNMRTEYTDSTTNLGVSATYTGTTRDTGTATTSKPAFLIARAYADQAGTLFIDQSRDGTVWRSSIGESQAIAIGETRTLRVPGYARYWRVRYVNSTVAQTAFELISAQQMI